MKKILIKVLILVALVSGAWGAVKFYYWYKVYHSQKTAENIVSSAVPLPPSIAEIVETPPAKEEPPPQVPKANPSPQKTSLQTIEEVEEVEEVKEIEKITPPQEEIEVLYEQPKDLLPPENIETLSLKTPSQTKEEIPPPPKNEEEPPTPQISKQGSFITVDNIHWAKGQAQIIEEDDDVLIVFSEDFQAAKGPDVYVLISESQPLKGSVGAVDISRTKNLGKLQKFKGSQAYKISKSDWKKYHHAIVLWCRAFDVHFSSALLK